MQSRVLILAGLWYNGIMQRREDDGLEASALTELDKLNHLYEEKTAILFLCHTLFPFDLFPATLVIDHNKIDIVYREFFGHSKTVSIPISHLNYVGVQSVWFLSSLRLKTKGLEQNPNPLHSLRTRDAQFAKNLLFGLMTAERHGIDLSNLSREAIVHKLIEIGKVA